MRCETEDANQIWHSAGTFDVHTKTGGPFRMIRHIDELAHGANNGLDIAVRLLEPIKEQFPILSYIFSGLLIPVLAIKDKSDPPLEGRLPDASKGLS
uniref:Uncharacterized protein n=1 Tax=Salix viminalis TaxID=40686 RepID=A0A6N2L9M9_SALVM